MIAEHLSRAKVCVAAISKASAESHNCRNEVSFTVANKTPLLSIVLEDFPMPLGMRYQLSSSNYIKKYDYQDEVFYQKLLSAPALASSKDQEKTAAPQELKMWRERADRYSNKQTIESNKAEIDAAWFAEKKKDGEKGKDAPRKVKATRKAITAAGIKAGKGRVAEKQEEKSNHTTAVSVEEQPTPNKEETRRKASQLQREEKQEHPAQAEEIFCEKFEAAHNDDSQPAPEEEDEPTVRADNELELFQDDEDDPTVFVKKTVKAALIRGSTGEFFLINKAKTKLGRQKKDVDVVLEGNTAISRVHAEILRYPTHFAICDLGSRFGTTINGESIVTGTEPKKLPEAAELYLADEAFYFISGSAAERISEQKRVCLLKCMETGETKILVDDIFPLDRRHKWGHGILGDEHIHRSGHAELIREKDHFFLKDLGSVSGTFHNGRRLAAEEKVEMKDGDLIAIYKTEFMFLEIPLK